MGSGKLQRAELLRLGDSLGAATDPQLAVDVGDVALDGRRTDE